MKEFSIQKDIGKDHIIITGLNCPGSAGVSKDGHAITLWRSYMANCSRARTLSD
jgi:hypothetical protein